MKLAVIDQSIKLKGNEHKGKKERKQTFRGLIEVVETNARGRGGRPRTQVVTTRNRCTGPMRITVTGDRNLEMQRVLVPGEGHSFHVPQGFVAKQLQVVALT